MSLQELIQEIRVLDVADQKRLWEMLDELLNQNTEQQKEQMFRDGLAAMGLLSSTGQGSIAEEPNYSPIEVKGKPVSETVIEERR